MSDYEKIKKDFKKRNRYAQALREQGDHKGAFSLKVHDARKGEYKRKNMRVNDIEEEQD